MAGVVRCNCQTTNSHESYRSTSHIQRANVRIRMLGICVLRLCIQTFKSNKTSKCIEIDVMLWLVLCNIYMHICNQIWHSRWHAGSHMWHKPNYSANHMIIIFDCKMSLWLWAANSGGKGIVLHIICFVRCRFLEGLVKTATPRRFHRLV